MLASAEALPASPRHAANAAATPLRAFLIGAALTVILMAPTWFYPPGRDQSVFSYVGTIIARGGMPYRDAWDLKPPGIYLLYALLARLSMLLGGDVFHWVRAADFLIVGATGGLLALYARRWMGPGLSAAVGAWYGALYMYGGYWVLAQAEIWSNLLAVSAALLCLRAAEQRKSALAGLASAGLLTGGIFVLKFTAILPLLPFLWLAVSSLGDRRRKLIAIGVIGVAAAIPALASAAWLIAGHAWDAYLDVQRGFLVPYTHLSASSPAVWAWRILAFTTKWAAPLFLPILLAIYGARTQPPSHPATETPTHPHTHTPTHLPALAILAGLISVWAQDKYFDYHWQPVLPWFALLAAAGTVRLLKNWPEIHRTAAAAAGVALVWALIARFSYFQGATMLVTRQLPEEQWVSRFGALWTGDYAFVADRWAAEYVREHSRPGEPLLIWGFEPAVYLLSGHYPPTRFFFNVPLSVQFAPEAWKREYLDAIQRRPPDLLLVMRLDNIPWANGRQDDSASQLAAWPELSTWVNTHYHRERRIEHFLIYRRN